MRANVEAGSVVGFSRRLRWILALATAALLCGAGASASAAVPFCTYGEGPGQCKELNGVAVDTTNGRVYVADTGNHRINVFDEDGNFLSSFGTPGTAPGQLSKPRHIAVDDDPTSPAFHDVYVVDGDVPWPGEDKFRVQRFNSSGAFVLSLGDGVVHGGGNPVAVGPGGTVYVGDDNDQPGVGAIRLIKRFTPAGVLLGSSSLPESIRIDFLAVDSNGYAYVAGLGIAQNIARYELSEPDATLLNSFDLAANTTALAVDEADNLYAAQLDTAQRHVITKRDSSGTILGRFGYEIETNLLGLAVGATDDLFGSEIGFGGGAGNKILRIEQPGPGAYACCLATTRGNTKATLEGGVNPEGKAATYHFEYVDQKSFEDEGGFASPKTIKAPESAPLAPDFDLHKAKAEIGCTGLQQPNCLIPSTAYRYRLVAENADGKNAAEGQFTTKPPFEILETYATEAGTDSVRLHATVNPVGISATAHFEYVAEATYQASGFAEATKTPEVDLGSGSTPKAISAQLSGLTPGVTYRYRVVLSDVFATEAGPERTLITFPLPAPSANSCPNALFRTGPSALLPDCRAYEMVSPVEKNGGDAGRVLLNIINFPARLERSSPDGSSLAYSSATAFADSLSAAYTSEYLASRGPGGWSSESLNAPRDSKALTDQYTRFDVPYHHFSSDLSSGWLFQDANPTLDECAPEGFINLYRRDNTTGSYEALIPAAPPANDPLEGYRPELQGFSADGTHTVFRANTKLTPDAAGAKGQDAYQLYMHVRDPEGGCGELRLVSFKPNGVASTQAASAGTPRGPGEYRESTVARAVSDDGTRVFFSFNTIAIGRGPLYARVNADQPQGAVSGGKCTPAAIAEGRGCTFEISPAAAQFWTAATDGSRAIYSVGEELFEYDVDKALAGEAASTLIAEGLPVGKGVAGASEDASRIYFVSTEAIEGEGEAGKPNLYLYEPLKSGPERYRLVATLVGSDLRGLRFWGFAVADPEMVRNGVRLTADGGKLAFVSRANLTGYETADARDGVANLEVYLYDAASEELRCVSCNPSGARPRGREFREGASSVRVSAIMPAGQDQLFAPRALSADGNRLFFESFEALLPRDTNGKGDVYGWQRAASKAECDANGAERYVPSSGGCLSLISTGQSPIDTEIADVSPDGSNVFIRTAESLLPQDPGSMDIYVARIGGGFPQPPPQPAACEGEACQGPLVPPNDPTPSSLSFQGAGNVNERSAKPRPRCAKGKARRKGRCVPRKPSKRAMQASHNWRTPR